MLLTDRFRKHPSSETRLGCCCLGWCLGQPPPPQTRMHAGPLTSTHPLRAQRSQLPPLICWDALLAKVPVAKSDVAPRNPHGGKKELTSISCQLFSIHVSWHVHIPQNKYFFKRSQPPPPDKAKQGGGEVCDPRPSSYTTPISCGVREVGEVPKGVCRHCGQS